MEIRYFKGPPLEPFYTMGGSSILRMVPLKGKIFKYEPTGIFPFFFSTGFVKINFLFFLFLKTAFQRYFILDSNLPVTTVFLKTIKLATDFFKNNQSSLVLSPILSKTKSCQSK